MVQYKVIPSDTVQGNTVGTIQGDTIVCPQVTDLLSSPWFPEFPQMMWLRFSTQSQGHDGMCHDVYNDKPHLPLCNTPQGP